MTRVREVISDQGSDLAEMINAAAGDYADSYTGVLIAESGLNEYAHRDTKWPDYSSGLSQVIAPNLGYGTYAMRPPDETLAAYDDYMYRAQNAIKEGWRYYESALRRMGGDPLWAALSYNRGPSYTRAQLEQQVADDPSIARRLEHYRASFALAEQYVEEDEMALVVGQGLLDRMTSQSDKPMSDEYTLRVNADGTLTQAALGTKGMYLWHETTGASGPLPVAA